MLVWRKEDEGLIIKAIITGTAVWNNRDSLPWFGPCWGFLTLCVSFSFQRCWGSILLAQDHSWIPATLLSLQTTNPRVVLGLSQTCQPTSSSCACHAERRRDESRARSLLDAAIDAIVVMKVLGWGWAELRSRSFAGLPGVALGQAV